LKPTRKFSGIEGNYSKGLEGPEALKEDIDIINKMFDPLAVHEDLSPGGVGEENLQSGVNTKLNSAAAAFVNSGEAITKANQALTDSSAALSQSTTALSQSNIASSVSTLALNTINQAMQELQAAIETAQQAVIDAQNAVGNTEIIYDVFTIITADNGNGTFTYTKGQGNIVGQIVNSAQRLELSSTYNVGANRIEITVNDTLTRSQASGGLREVGSAGSASSLVDLTAVASNGAEITIKYYKQLSLGGRHAASHNVGASDEFIRISPNNPVQWHAGQLFFKVV